MVRIPAVRSGTARISLRETHPAVRTEKSPTAQMNLPTPAGRKIPGRRSGTTPTCLKSRLPPWGEYLRATTAASQLAGCGIRTPVTGSLSPFRPRSITASCVAFPVSE